MFKLIGEAYAVLSEPRNRAAYDSRDRSATHDHRSSWFPEGYSFNFDAAQETFRTVFGDEFVENLKAGAGFVGKVVQEGVGGAASAIADVSSQVRKADAVRTPVLTGLRAATTEKGREAECASRACLQTKDVAEQRRQELHDRERECQADSYARRLEMRRLQKFSSLAVFGIMIYVLVCIIVTCTLGNRPHFVGVLTLLWLLLTFPILLMMWMCKKYGRLRGINDAQEHAQREELDLLRNRLRAAEQVYRLEKDRSDLAQHHAREAQAEEQRVEEEGVTWSSLWRLGSSYFSQSQAREPILRSASSSV